MTIGLRYQALAGTHSEGGHVVHVGRMVFDRVDVSGVCSISRSGEIDTSPGGSPDIDVTIGFDQPSAFDWPPKPPNGNKPRADYAIQSTSAPAPAGWCSLPPGAWAYPTHQPTIDPAGHVLFTMPKKVGQTLTYQLYYVSKGGGAPKCIDPDIINH
jgi:hypothetical protein